tara:strand:+ start:6598 stop:7833 length:1236 start_codon:yes stop_codon:yes gene_type:complete
MLVKKKFEKLSTKSQWFCWVRSLLDLYDTEKHFSIGDSVYRSSFLGMRRWILAHPFEGSDLLLRNLLLDSMISANKIPGSEIYVPWFLYNSLDMVEPLRHNSKIYLEATLSKTKRKFISDIFYSVYGIVGPLTKIVLKPSSECDVVIKSRNAFCFPLQIDAQFHRVLGYIEYIELINPLIIMIEGAPETLGEINSLLERNHETERPVVLIARSFPEEISATLATNWLKNSLSILPVIYGDDLETINLAADLSTVTKGELISSHFGDVISISVLDEAKWGTADRVEWTSRGLSVYKEADTRSQVHRLINKIKETDNKELEDLLQNRILSLSNDAIEIWVPEKEIQLLEELDALFKHYNAFVVSGAVDTPIGLIPKSFVDAAHSAAQSLKNEILNIGGFLVRVDDEVVAGKGQ